MDLSETEKTPREEKEEESTCVSRTLRLFKNVNVIITEKYLIIFFTLSLSYITLVITSLNCHFKLYNQTGFMMNLNDNLKNSIQIKKLPKHIY